MAKNSQFWPTLKLDNFDRTHALVWGLCDDPTNSETLFEHFDWLYCNEEQNLLKIFDFLAENWLFSLPFCWFMKFYSIKLMATHASAKVEVITLVKSCSWCYNIDETHQFWWVFVNHSLFMAHFINFLLLFHY